MTFGAPNFTEIESASADARGGSLNRFCLAPNLAVIGTHPAIERPIRATSKSDPRAILSLSNSTAQVLKDEAESSMGVVP